MEDITILYTGNLVTRKEATSLGLKRYFTGLPCPYGHIDQRNTKSCACVFCTSQAMFKWREKSRDLISLYNKSEKVRARKREQYDPIKAKERRAKLDPQLKQKYQEKYRDKHREELNRKKVKYNKLNWSKQKVRIEAKKEQISGRPRPMVCELCNEPHPKVVFDHCHKTGSFRGWICDRCNKVLGLVKDDILLLLKMSEYLEDFNGKIVNQTKKQDTNFAICGT